MSPENTTPRCAATTAKDQPCRARPVPGATVCRVHAGAPVGRPSLLTPEVQARIAQILRAGGYIEAAAAAAGVSRAAVFAWLKRGAGDVGPADDEPYRDFRRTIEQARAEGEARNVAIVATAAATDWKAAAWLLERQFPERWGRPSQRTTAPAESPPAEPDEDAPEGEGATVTPLGVLRRRAAAAVR